MFGKHFAFAHENSNHVYYGYSTRHKLVYLFLSIFAYNIERNEANKNLTLPFLQKYEMQMRNHQTNLSMPTTTEPQALQTPDPNPYNQNWRQTDSADCQWEII